MIRMLKRIIAAFVTLTILYGCGGGGEGGIDGTGQNPVYLEGTAAVGAPISNSKIYVKGKNGNKVETVTDENGVFKADVSTQPITI